MEQKRRRSSVSEAYAAALRLLTRRGYAEAELSGRLRDKGYSAEEADAALARCRDLGYLNDAHFAQQRALALLRNGRAVGRRARLDLRQRGIDDDLAVAAVAAAATGAALSPLRLCHRRCCQPAPGHQFFFASGF